MPKRTRNRRWNSAAIDAENVLRELVLALLAFASICLFGCESKVDDPRFGQMDVFSPSNAAQFELTALRVDADLGALKSGESAVAVFPIRNYGAIAAHLELGTPTCSCSKIDLDKPTLQPGETATVRMAVANRGKFGLFKTSVTVSASSQKFSEILTANAFGSGFRILSPTIRVPDAALDKPIVIAGRLFVPQASTGIDVDVQVLAVGAERRTGSLKLAQLRLHEPRASEHGFERDVEIAVPSLPTLVGGSKDFRDTIVLSLSATFDGIKQCDTVLVKRAS